MSAFWGPSHGERMTWNPPSKLARTDLDQSKLATAGRKGNDDADVGASMDSYNKWMNEVSGYQKLREQSNIRTRERLEHLLVMEK